MMTKDLCRALDPALIAIDAGITPDPWQATLLRERPRRSLLLCSRQSGKSTVTALTALDTAIYQAPALVLLVSPSQRQSAELFRTVMLFHSKLSGAPPLSKESVLRAEFASGSRILALPGTERTIRGYAKADLVMIDKAARVEDELLAAVRPMLATSTGGGRLIALTTPAGKRGWFFDAWTGTDDWHRTKVSAADCPRITKEFLDEELRELGQQRFSEEYGLEFLDPDEAVFPTHIIDQAFTPEVMPLWN
jgi:Terminase large subunit, T4likevirus-type, N-terminal